MRAALEYLAWELARLDSPGEPPSTTGFPIYSDPDDYHATRRDGKPQPWSGLKKVERISEEAQEAIEALQPFNSWADPIPGVSPGVVWTPREGQERPPRKHALLTLDALAKSDRHRALRVIGATTTSYGTANPSGSPEPEHGTTNNLGPVEDGAVVARYFFKRPGATLRATGLTVNPQLQAEPEPRSWSVIVALGDILSYLDGKVAPRFARFF